MRPLQSFTDRLRPLAWLPCILGLVMTSQALAQEKTIGAQTAELVAPLQDAEALVVARVDLRKIDFDAALTWTAKAMKLGDMERDQLENTLQEPRRFVDAFRAAGGREIIWLIYPGSIHTREPIELAGVATADQGMAEKLAGALGALLPRNHFQVAVHGDHVMIAPKHRMEALDDRARPSPALAKALDAAGAGTIQAALLLPDDLRRVVRESLGPLPKEAGGISGKEVADWFSWGSLSLTAPPQPRLRLTIQATSEEAAQSLQRAAVNAYEAAGDAKNARKHIPQFDEIIRFLTPKVAGTQVVLSVGENPGEMDKLLPLIALPLQEARNAATRAQHANQLKQIGLAMHMYHDVHRRLPAHASYSEEGKPLLSWRVHLLPYLDQNDLYKQFRLDQPWDSAHNKKLIKKMPGVYKDPRVPVKEAGRTTFVVPTGKKLVFGDKEGLPFQKITDGTSSTILVLESDASSAVVWTKPDDLAFDPADPLKGLFFDGKGTVAVLIADGSVQWLKDAEAKKSLPAYVTPAGGEVIPRE